MKTNAGVGFNRALRFGLIALVTCGLVGAQQTLAKSKGPDKCKDHDKCREHDKCRDHDKGHAKCKSKRPDPCKDHDRCKAHDKCRDHDKAHKKCKSKDPCRNHDKCREHNKCREHDKNHKKCRPTQPPQPPPCEVQFSGRATLVYLTNLHVGPSTILIGDTGPVPASGGNLSVIVGPTNIGGDFFLELGEAAVSAGSGVSQSTVVITNFGINFVATNGTGHTLMFDLLEVVARAECASNGPVVSASTSIQGLEIDGTAVTVSGEANQVIAIDGGTIIINAQAEATAGGLGQITVAGIVIRLDGCMTGPIGLVHADIRCCDAQQPPQPPAAGAFTIGYWKNHQDHVAALLQQGAIDLGDVTVSTTAQAVAVLSNSSATDARNSLRAQLLAAILNLRNGANPLATGIDIRVTIQQSIQFLHTHPAPVLGGHPDRAAGLALKDQLDRFNNS